MRPLSIEKRQTPTLYFLSRGSQLASRTSGPLSICSIESALIGFDFEVDIAESYWESRTSVYHLWTTIGASTREGNNVSGISMTSLARLLSRFGEISWKTDPPPILLGWLKVGQQGSRAGRANVKRNLKTATHDCDNLTKTFFLFRDVDADTSRVRGGKDVVSSDVATNIARR